MLVFCEECGKRYSFPPEKVEPGSDTFRCRECHFLIRVNMPDSSENEEGKKEVSGQDTAPDRPSDTLS